MRIPHDLLNCVVFFGHYVDEGRAFTPCGTGFLLAHDKMLYIVTAKHVAQELGDNPFHIRLNTVDGGHGIAPFDFEMESEDRFRWFAHPEACADVAIIPFPVHLRDHGFEAVFLHSRGVVEQTNPMQDAGCGDMCHVVGLFMFRPGNSRNIAVAHTGHIACLSDSRELIETTHKGRSMLVEGHLVEISNLEGLSGAPVFVRDGVEMEIALNASDKEALSIHRTRLKLLGVWHGSWDVPVARTNRVPVGMGIVVPAYRLIELLDSEPVVENRRLWQLEESAAKAG